MLAVEKHKGTFLAPVGIGLSLFSAELAGEYSRGLSHLAAANSPRCLLHRWFFEPCSQLWSLRCQLLLPPRTLDLLAWPFTGIFDSLRLLLVHQELRIPNCQSWSGLRRSGGFRLQSRIGHHSTRRQSHGSDRTSAFSRRRAEDFKGR